jgi:hypothetical protein
MERLLMPASFRVIAIVCFIAAAQPVNAIAGAYISDKSLFKLETGHVVVAPGQFWSKPISLQQGAKLRIDVKVHNLFFDDVDAYYCDAFGFTWYKAGQRSYCTGTKRGKGKFSILAENQEAEAHHLIIDNRTSRLLAKKVSYTITVLARLSDRSRYGMSKSLDDFTKYIAKVFAVKELNIFIIPCGTDNAGSIDKTGDIIICTELEMTFLMKGRANGLFAFITHQIGRILLKQWGLSEPNIDVTADEFAAVILHYHNRSEGTLELMKWLQENPCYSTTPRKVCKRAEIQSTAQRIRNIERIRNNPEPFVRKWDRLLFPRMTLHGLDEMLELQSRAFPIYFEA